MAQRVFRYPVRPSFPARMQLPEETLWVRFGLAPQSGDLSIWAVNVDGEPLVEYDVFVVGTGHDIDEDYNYFDTYIDDGGFVWHLFSKPVM